jgi:hypothetical protein
MEAQPASNETRRGNGKVTTPEPQRQFYSLSELAKVTGKAYRSIHRAVRAGKIRTVTFGGSRMIPEHEYRRVLAHGWRWEPGEQRQRIPADGGPPAKAQAQRRQRKGRQPEHSATQETVAQLAATGPGRAD